MSGDAEVLQVSCSFFLHLVEGDEVCRQAVQTDLLFRKAILYQFFCSPLYLVQDSKVGRRRSAPGEAEVLKGTRVCTAAPVPCCPGILTSF